MLGIQECGVVSRQLWEYVDGRLDAVAGRRIEIHLATCDRCKHEITQIKQAASLFRDYRDDGHIRDMDDWDALRSELNVVSSSRLSFGRRLALLPRTLVYPAAATLAIILFLLLRTSFLPSHLTAVVSGKDSYGQRPTPAIYPQPKREDRPAAIAAVNVRWHSPTSRQHRGGPDSSEAVRPQDDMDYLNAAPLGGSLAQHSPSSDADSKLDEYANNLTRVGDDFVHVPPIRVAGGSREAIAAAAAAYIQEKQVVDARLARRITLSVKAMALSDLCALIEEKTQVEMRAIRGVADEKVTIFCDEIPARDIMRAINQTFGYSWARLGDEGGYRYELSQDLKSRLQEEELRARDLNEALLALDDKLDVGSGQKPDGNVKRSPYVQLFSGLSPEDKVALRNGKRIVLRGNGQTGSHTIPESLRRPLLATFGPVKVNSTGRITDPDGEGTDLVNLPGARVEVGFHIAHTELGQITLQQSTACRYPFPGGGETGVGSPESFGQILASGKSSTTTKIENERLNSALRNEPEFKKLISLNPEISCPSLKRGEVPHQPGERFETVELMHATNTYPTPTSHVNSADVWQEIHKKTGLTIVADYYTHVYPSDDFVIEKAPTFLALCRIGDKLGIRWRMESNILIGRSADWFWSKLKEVPERQLAKWRTDSRAQAGLPFSDILEMIQLSDPQLESTLVATGIRHCEQVREWDLVHVDSTGGRAYSLVRRGVLRSLAQAKPAVVAQALSQNGIAFKDLTPGQQDTLFGGLANANHQLKTILDARIHIDYVPQGRYVWNHRTDLVHDGVELSALPVISADTPEKAFELARQRDPQATLQNISKTESGILGITVIYPDGKMWAMGKPENSLR